VGDEARPDDREDTATRRSRAFAQIDHRLTQITDVLRGTWEGIGLGVLDRDEFDSLVSRYYREQRNYRADEWNRSGLLPWEREIIDRYFRDCKSLLVGAAGGGREALALDRMGFDVHGFECNPKLVDWANDFLRRSDARATIEVAPPDAAPPDLELRDGVIMGWGGFSHVVGRRARMNLLRDLRRAVDVGAPFLLSFWTMSDENRRRLKVASWVGPRVLRVARPNGRDALSFGDSVSRRGYLHHFSRDQVAEEVTEAGFDIVEFSDRHCYHYSHLVASAR
jgi:hypothetical protein